jgi:hypothetical protein
MFFFSLRLLDVFLFCAATYIIPPLLFLARYGAFWPFAGACVLFCALAPHGKPFPVADAPVAAYLHEPFYVHGNLAPEVALDLYIVVDVFTELGYIRLRKIPYPYVGIDIVSANIFWDVVSPIP